VVEFAVVAPLLFLLIFGMIEFGRMVMVQQILTNASREGARRGILEQSTATEVEFADEFNAVVEGVQRESLAADPGTTVASNLSEEEGSELAHAC
jgi:Flp pilus assembly protein TadG